MKRERSTFTPSGRRWLVAIFAAGLVVRVIFLLTTTGVGPDIDAYYATGRAFVHSGLHLYRALDTGDRWHPYWPYPPGYVPVASTLVAISHVVHVPFVWLVKVPLIAADLGIAAAVVSFLGLRGADERTRLLAAALVALGPSFIVISSVHGQLDAVATLAGLLGFIAWEKFGRERAAATGALIGIAAAIKTAPIVLLLALVPRGRSRRETIVLVSIACGVLILVLGPFFIVEPRATIKALRYSGIAGFGGLSLLLQPSLAGWWSGKGSRPNSVTNFVSSHQVFMVAIVYGVAFLVLARKRPRPEHGAVFLWLAFFVLIPNFALQYLVWGLPYLLISERLRFVAFLQALLVVPTIILYTRADLFGVYVLLMGLVYVVLVYGLIDQTKRIMRGVESPEVRVPALS